MKTFPKTAVTLSSSHPDAKHTATSYTMKESEILRCAHAITYPDYGNVYQAYDELNELCFDGSLPTLPIRHGIMPYGRCIGLTSYRDSPLISLAENIMRDDEKWRDVLIHEMLHAALMLAKRNPDHNKVPWCEEITRITPLLGLPPIKAEPIRQKRIEGRVTWFTEDGYLTRKALASWPQSIRK